MIALAPDTDTAAIAPGGEAEGASSQAGAALAPAVSSETGGGEGTAKPVASSTSETSGGSKATRKSKGGGSPEESSRGGSKSADGGVSARDLTLAAHPRAARRVAEAKAWGALAGFVLGGYLSLPTHTTIDAAVRALAAGAFCYVTVWGAAVFLWRRLVVAELREAEEQLLAAKLANGHAAQAHALPGGETSQAGG